jgi:hypothetical protein
LQLEGGALNPTVFTIMYCCHPLSPPAITSARFAIPKPADLTEYIATNGLLTPRQQQETCSALGTVARAVGRRPEEIAASPRHLRERLVQLTPGMAGVTQGRWNNVLSLTRGALKHAGLANIAGRSTEPMASEWRDLFYHLNNRRMREGLSRFARYCSASGINPSNVSDIVAASFLAALEDEGIIRNPGQVHRTMCVVWNRAAESIAAWPPSRLNIPQYRQTYSLSWSDFPPSLVKEAAAYLERLGGRDLLVELDFRPLRIASIQSYDRLLRAFLSALVHRGHDTQGFRSLADVIAVDRVKDGLPFFIERAAFSIERAGGTKTKQAYNIARMLTALARHWVRVEADHLNQLRALCRRLDSERLA